MNQVDKIMELVAYYGGWREARGKAHAASVAAEKEIRKEIKALVRDAERYRHLRDGVLVDGEINEDMYVHVDHPSYPNRWALIGDELDEAVDAAMQEKQS